ncbi:hypothetical protein [Brevibacillus laterosporus]|uniref:hypothetical protein n=1 Tax=Brevibacillus laterosporus TaxID=1465 RepID=UPI003D19D401
MEKDLSTLVDLVNQAYPDLTIIVNLEEWLSGSFTPPVAFIETQSVTEKANSLTTYRVIADAGIVIHYLKENGYYKTVSSEPLRTILRKEKYSYRGKTDGLLIDINPSTLEVTNSKKDRTEITFRFEYLLTVPREKVEKINTFEVEEGYHG